MGLPVSTHCSRKLMASRSLAALVAASTIAGCAVGPVYKRPDVTPVAEFRSQVGPTEATSIADLPWWSIFNDKALQSLITEALTNNFDLQVAVSRIEQARALVGVARADYYPQVGYQGFAGREKAFVPLEGSTGNVSFNTFGALGQRRLGNRCLGAHPLFDRRCPRESLCPGGCAPRRNADARQQRRRKLLLR